jgi:hypothetical protein
MKNGGPSIGFCPAGTVSSSTIVTVAVAGEPRIAPEGSLKLTVKVSLFSKSASLITGMMKLLLASPAAKRSVPAVVS